MSLIKSPYIMYKKRFLLAVLSLFCFGLIYGCGSTMPRTDQAIFGKSRTKLQIQAVDAFPVDQQLLVTLDMTINPQPQAIPAYTKCQLVAQSTPLTSAGVESYSSEPKWRCTDVLDHYLIGAVMVPLISEELEEGQISCPTFLLPYSQVKTIKVVKKFISASPDGSGAIYAFVQIE